MLQDLGEEGRLAVINLAAPTITGVWSIPQCEEPKGMAIDVAQRRLFVVCSKEGRLAVMNLESRALVASVKIGSNPDSIAFDEELRRIYITSRGGHMTIAGQIDADHYEVLDQIRTSFGAHTLAIEPKTHRVFLSYASLSANPRVAVFSPILTGQKPNAGW